MADTRPFEELAARARADPARRARIAAYRRAMEDVLLLARLREERGKTQAEVAQALDVTQANVSRIEHEEDIYLSTLRSYVAALGGRLEIRAVFPDHSVSILAPRESEADAAR